MGLIFDYVCIRSSFVFWTEEWTEHALFFLVRSKWTDFERTCFVRLNFTLKSMVNGSNGFYIRSSALHRKYWLSLMNRSKRIQTDALCLFFLDWSVQQIRLKCFFFFFFKLCIRSFWTEQTNVCSVDTALLYTHLSLRVYATHWCPLVSTGDVLFS